MGIWTRQYQPDGTRRWVSVRDNQAIIAWLQNALLLQLGESPFWADWGLPVTQMLVTQVWPDYYVHMTKQRFEDYFTSLRITRDTAQDSAEPSYTISALFADGSSYHSGQQQFNQRFSQTGPFHGTK